TEIKRIHEKAATEIKRIHDKAATEIKRIHDKAATEIAQAKADVARVEGERKSEVARVEGERRLSEERLRAEVERYKYDLRLTQTQDFEPYQAAIRENPNKEGRSRRTAGLGFGTVYRCVKYSQDIFKDMYSGRGYEEEPPPLVEGGGLGADGAVGRREEVIMWKLGVKDLSQRLSASEESHPKRVPGTTWCCQ
ncbi:hypothetical protein NSK_005522, partial [Nannochloropsis salina CCMP1776]